VFSVSIRVVVGLIFGGFSSYWCEFGAVWVWIFARFWFCFGVIWWSFLVRVGGFGWAWGLPMLGGLGMGGLSLGGRGVQGPGAGHRVLGGPVGSDKLIRQRLGRGLVLQIEIVCNFSDFFFPTPP
jgi:hypothetical protein